jgi:hypothetical protein
MKTLIEKLRLAWMTTLAGGLASLVLFNATAVSAASTDVIPADRRIDWRPGIPGGIPDTSTWTVVNVKNAPYNAVGNGVADDTTAIQNALDAATPNSVVYLPAGTYRVTRSLSIDYNKPKRYMVIRGAGQGLTNIKYDGTADINIVNIQNSDVGTSDNLTGGYSKGSTSISVATPTSYVVGDYILIDQVNAPNLVNTLTDAYHSRNSGTRVMGQVVKITAKSGSTVTIDPPLHISFSASQSPQAFFTLQTSTASHHVGVESLTITNTASIGSSGVTLSHATQCWVKNVETANIGGYHIYLLYGSFQCEVRDCYMHHGTSYDGDHAYGVSLTRQATDNLIENNIGYHLRHAMLIQSGGTGNVIAYNYTDRMFSYDYPDTDWMMGDLITHGSHPYMNLFEGNQSNTMYYDNVHGSSSHNTTFRNSLTSATQGENRAIIYVLRGVAIDQYNYYQNIVGNVLNLEGQTGVYETSSYTDYLLRTAFRDGWTTVTSLGAPSDPNVDSTAIRHGNYSYLDHRTHWDASISTTSLPASYYLTSKPAWFGSVPWPPIGPDVAGYVNDIPAKRRFFQMQTGKPAPPTNLRITSS